MSAVVRCLRTDRGSVAVRRALPRDALVRVIADGSAPGVAAREVKAVDNDLRRWLGTP